MKKIIVITASLTLLAATTAVILIILTQSGLKKIPDAEFGLLIAHGEENLGRCSGLDGGFDGGDRGGKLALTA